MNAVRVIMTFLILVSSSCYAEEGSEVIRIFVNDANPVKMDINLPSHIQVHRYDLDSRDKLKVAFNEKLRQRVGKVHPSEVKAAYSKAASELMNSPEWRVFYEELEESAMTIVNVARFKIQKVPAIVINDESVLYGVTSLREAIEIYGAKR